MMDSNEVITTKGRKFPMVIHVKWDGMDSDSPWMSAYQDASDALDGGETVYVAEYKLVTVRKGKMVPEFNK